MADVIIKYGQDTIAEMNENGDRTLKTSGKYCEKDISVTLIQKDSGSGNSQDIINTMFWFYTAHKKEV